MSGPVLHLGAVVMCSHAGPATPLSPSPRVLLSGQPAVTIAAPWGVTGCSLTGSAPPCMTGQMITGSSRVLASGMPLATMGGASTCLPTGTPLLPASAQPRVVVT